MAHLDLLRTVHYPVSADGRSIKNSFGVVIATCMDEFTAAGLAEMVNLAIPEANKKSELYAAKERSRAVDLILWLKTREE